MPSARPESRKQPRISCTLSVQVHAPEQDVLLFTYATDISNEGVYVRANRPLPVGAEVHLDLQPHAPNERLTVDGTVVHVVDNGSGPRGMGVAFSVTDDEARDGIRRLVERIDFRPMLTVADAETYSRFGPG